jgi:hypothetical protein
MYGGVVSLIPGTCVIEKVMSLRFRKKEDIALGCPSGNCTFPSFQTISMCHTCSEANALIRSNDTFQGYWLENCHNPHGEIGRTGLHT